MTRTVSWSRRSLAPCVVALAGGGLFSTAPGGRVFVFDTTFSGNTALTEFGGGIALFAITDTGAEVSNSTISGNRAAGGGAGIFSSPVTLVSIFNTTITDNHAGLGEAGG